MTRTTAGSGTGRVTRLPPRSQQGAREGELGEVEFLAWLLDNSIRVPGTGGRRIGLDALIGFIPGLGDIVSGALGLWVVVRAAAIGVPRIVLVRMLVNLGLDFVIGAIPVIGDAFDLWFKSNARNVGLLRRYAADPGASTRGQWGFLLVVAAIAIVVALAVAWLVVSAIGWMLSQF